MNDPGADPRSRHPECGAAWNPYRWGGDCPQCHCTTEGVYGLRCHACRNAWFGAERVDLCPDCGSGETACRFTPDPEW